MAETKIKKTITTNSVETASEREALVKKVSAQQKAASKTKKSTAQTEKTVRSVVRTQSLEEKYLAKLQGDKKTSPVKTSTKSTATKTAVTKATQQKAPVKQAVKSGTTQTKTVKVAPKIDDGNKDVRIGNVVVDKHMANAKVGMQEGNKDKQKNLAIVILSSLLAVVIILSVVFVLGNLNKEDVATMKVQGSGATWLINGKDHDSFSLVGGEEVSPYCMINIDLSLKKTTNDTINVRIELQSFKNGVEFDKTMLKFQNPNSALIADEANGTYTLQNWSVSSGSKIKLCDGFVVLTTDNSINNDNYRIVVTAVIY